MEEFERIRDIPEEIVCENHDGGHRIHKTEGNIWLKVGHETMEETPTRIIWLAVGFVALLTIATFVFVLMLHYFHEPVTRGFIIVGYLLTVLAPLAAIMKIFGREASDWAASLIKHVKGWFGS
jgi:hypothetical protein